MCGVYDNRVVVDESIAVASSDVRWSLDPLKRKTRPIITTVSKNIIQYGYCIQVGSFHSVVLRTLVIIIITLLIFAVDIDPTFGFAAKRRNERKRIDFLVVLKPELTRVNTQVANTGNS